MVFGGPLPPPVLGASIASADIHLSDEIGELQADLLQRVDLVNELSSDLGLPLATSERTPLWFVEIGPVRTAMTVARAMAKEGFYVNIAGFPVVPRGRGGVRFTVTRYNTRADIEGMLSCLRESWLEHGGPDEVVDLTVLEDEEVRQATER
jgi:7-keto-8-aminopelargonate synthetase-like enzyme